MRTSWRSASQMEEMYSWPISCTSHGRKENQRRDSVVLQFWSGRGLQKTWPNYRSGKEARCVGVVSWCSLVLWLADPFLPSHLSVLEELTTNFGGKLFQLTHCSHLSRAYISAWIETSEWVQINLPILILGTLLPTNSQTSSVSSTSHAGFSCFLRNYLQEVLQVLYSLLSLEFPYLTYSDEPWISEFPPPGGSSTPI